MRSASSAAPVGDPATTDAPVVAAISDRLDDVQNETNILRVLAFAHLRRRNDDVLLSAVAVSLNAIDQATSELRRLLDVHPQTGSAA